MTWKPSFEARDDEKVPSALQNLVSFLRVSREGNPPACVSTRLFQLTETRRYRVPAGLPGR